MQLPRTLRAGLAAAFAAFAVSACDQLGKTDAPQTPTPATTPAAATLDVYFFKAENCIYSQATEPTLQAFVSNPANAGRLRVIPVSRESHPELFAHYDVRNTPTLIFMRGGTDDFVIRIPEAAGDQAYMEGIVQRAEAALTAQSPLLALAAKQNTPASNTAPQPAR